MRLVEVRLANFRAYQEEQSFNVSDLTALIGRNDAGKSTVLDALGLFFDHQLCKADVGDRCVHSSEDAEVSVTCVFTELPEAIVLDDTSETSLKDEYLVTGNGSLAIKKVFSGKTFKAEPYILAIHPSIPDCCDLLTKKNPELKKLASQLKAAADERSNTSLRKAIRNAFEDLRLKPSLINLKSTTGKEIWSAIEAQLPIFNLFRADRPSTDDESEVQDPLRVAIKEALRSQSIELNRIAECVRQQTLDVAQRTLAKLGELDPTLAKSLTPVFRADPKWESLFKLSLDGDDGIPVNKRGSGVRRLILLSFFQAEVERLRVAAGEKAVIYAIEEPETSQHPENQRRVVDALVRISEEPGRQVLLTTHVPALAARLPVHGVRYVTQNDHTRKAIQERADMQIIASDLGVLPDLFGPVKILVCVEGPTDVDIIRVLARVVRTEDPDLPDLDSADIVMIPLGGDTLKDWVNRRYLKDFNLPEFHLYDGDKATSAKHELTSLSKRGDGSVGLLTKKREIENYLHEATLPEQVKGKVKITDDCDVEAELRAALGKKRLGGRKLKRILAEECAPRMNAGLLKDRNGFEEVRSWLKTIGSVLEQASVKG